MKHVLVFAFCVVTVGASPVIDSISGAASFKNKKFDELKTAGSIDLEAVCAYSILACGAISFKSLIVEDAMTTKGGCSGDGLVSKSLVCHGGAKIKNAKVQNIEAHGGFSGDTIEVAQDFTLSGGLKVTNLTVKGLMTIHGEAKFIDSTLGDVSCAGKKQEFKNTVVHDIRVKPGNFGVDTGFSFLNWIISFFKNSKVDLVHIYLTGGTRVAGDIIFESVSGQVHLSPNATLAGTVKGGTVVND